MSSSKLAICILAVTLVITTALRLIGTSAKTILSTDEGCSYTYAACKGSEYYDCVLGEQKPLGAWVYAAEWKKFMQIEEAFGFREIADILTRFDIHPPLYFWLLHLWALIVGINAWTGPALNILLALAATLSLFGLARYTLGHAVEAALVALTWALSPAVFHTSFEARHYDLLALLTILFVWQTIRYADLGRTTKTLDFIFVLALTAAGALTHYYFSILVAGCCLYSVTLLVRRHRPRLLAELLAVLSGYVVFFLLHPHFYRSFLNERKEIGVYSNEDLLVRLGNVSNTFQQFIIMPVSLKYILVLALALGLVMIYHYKRLLPMARIRQVEWRGFHVLYFFLWTAGVQITLYLGYLSPQHAVLPKYFSMAWPFLAFLPVFILRFFGKFRNHLTIGFCLLLLLSAVKGLLLFNDFMARQPDPSAILKNSRAVVLDNASLNVLPRLMAKLPDNKLVFAAYRDYLLNHQEAWSNSLDSGAVYISVASPLLSNENSENRKKVYDIINHTYETEVIQGGIWGFGDLILIGRKRSVPSP